MALLSSHACISFKSVARRIVEAAEAVGEEALRIGAADERVDRLTAEVVWCARLGVGTTVGDVYGAVAIVGTDRQIGRASCRERV